MRRTAGLLLAVLVVVTGCGGEPGSEGDRPATGATGTITVFAAASLTDVMAELAAAFEEANPGAAVELSFGPSSGLVTQIVEGAPADVVATAAPEDVEDLVAAGALDGDPSTFATNALEVVVPAGNPGDVVGLEDLADPDLVVGLCQTDVPCGRLARQALAGAGVDPSIDTEEEDVRALLSKVEAGEVDVGVVYRTDVLAAGDVVEGIEIPDDLDVAATYPIAAVARAANPEGARAFIAHVLSEEARATLADAGFGPADPGAG